MNPVIALYGKFEYKSGMLAARMTFHFWSFADDAVEKRGNDDLGTFTFSKQR